VPSAETPGVAALRRRHGVAGRDESAWVPPVLKVVATENRDVPALAGAVDAFLGWSAASGRGRSRSRERAYAQVLRALSGLLLAPYAREAGSERLPAPVEPWVERIVAGAASPLEAARALASGTSR
jgi:LAO/AO transport system kinase